MTSRERVWERYGDDAELLERSSGRGRGMQYKVRITGTGETGWCSNPTAAWDCAASMFLKEEGDKFK